jgi:hypothetical protein
VVEVEVGVVLPPGVGVAVGVSTATTNRAVGSVDAEGTISAVGVTLDEGTSRVGQSNNGILLVAMVMWLRVFESVRGR